MEPPFMRGYWNSPENMLSRGTRRRWHEKGSPRYWPSSARASASDGRENLSKSGVNVPVEIVDSGSASKPRFQTKKKRSHKRRAKLSKTAAAVKMQAAYRGFRVRKSKPLKNLTAIAQAKKCMEELKRQVVDENVKELIRQSEKERLRIAEGLMSLLLKLDAIQGVDTIVWESRKAVIRELIKPQETVDAITAEKTLESEPLTKTAEESALPNEKKSPEVERVPTDIHASESNCAASSNTDLTSLETDLAEKVILSEKDDENKGFPDVKKLEPSPEVINPKEKELVEEMASLNEIMDSSRTVSGFSETLNDPSGHVKYYYDSLVTVKDSSEAGTFSSGGDVNDNDDVSIVDQEQTSSHMPQIESNESGEMEEDFRSAKRNAIVQETFEILDQIKSRIAEGQAQKYNEVPLQANGAVNIVQKNEEKLKEAIGEHSVGTSDELHKSEDTSNQGKLSQQDEIAEAKVSVQANNSKEAACVKKREGTNKDMRSFLQRQDDDDECKGESTIMSVETVFEENKKLNKIIEDLYQRNQMQTDIFAHISYKLERLEHRMMHLNNKQRSVWTKEKEPLQFKHFSRCI